MRLLNLLRQTRVNQIHVKIFVQETCWKRDRAPVPISAANSSLVMNSRSPTGLQGISPRHLLHLDVQLGVKLE